ncbi:MAG: radical SAM protein [archaeon]
MKFDNLFPPTIDGTVYLEITHNCNFRCKHCYVKAPQKKQMTLEQVKYIAKILKKYGFKKVLLTGGEPLLHKDIKEITELLKKDFKVVLITNGTLIKEVNLDYNQFDGIYISYDGPSDKEYKALRGKGGFFIVQDNIKHLVKQGSKVAIGIILTKYNIDKIDDLVEQARELNVDKINLTVTQPFGRTLKNKDLILTPEEYFKIIPKLSKIKDIHFESMLCYPKELRNDSKTVKKLSLFDKYMSGCAAGKKFIYINPDGNVTPCGYITADNELMKETGNIFKMDLKDIYKTKLFQFFMNRSWESVKGKCKCCDYSVICKGGCPFRSHYLKGNPQLPDPWCMNEPEKNKYIESKVDIKNFEKVEAIC